jgi:hypothetical protein
VTMSRSIRLIYIACSVAWAACLAITGLWLLLETPPVLLVPAPAVALTGVVCIAAGNFVFMVRVADQSFPIVARRQISWVIEMTILAMICMLLIWIGVGL